MRKLFMLILALVPGLQLLAAGSDTVRTATGGACWSIPRKLGPGERIDMLEKRYKLPSGTLERAYPALRNISGSGEIVEVPLGAYNRIVDMPWSLDTARPLYYKVQPGEKLSDLSRCSRISRTDLMLFNSLSGEPSPGTYVCVGWVRYDRRIMASSPLPAGGLGGRPTTPGQQPQAQVLPARPAGSVRVPQQQPAQPTPVAPPVTYSPNEEPYSPEPARPPVQTMGDIWNEQTQNGENVSTEKGSVAFYALSSKAPGAAAYAFHNTAPRGGIIKVRNMNNGRSIFVKVLGPLPNTKQYNGAILGLTMTAKRALGVQEERAFCELSFAGY
jgi:hypothetical protein